MRQIQLLDCTLRDGGYLNDWEFGHGQLISILERTIESGVDIVELGFLDDRRPFDFNRSIMPDTASMKKIYGGVDKKSSMWVGMIDYGTCSIENIQPCDDSCLDGMRVIFKKGVMHEAMDYCAKVKALGYKVCSQLVSITSYSDEELMELIALVNEVKPYAVSMVDTYGLLTPDELIHYYDLLDEFVDEEISIGFHAHNNFQLAFANSITFLKKETRHNVIVDGTILGMGKSAGNAPIELIMMDLNKNYGKSYDVAHILEAIEESVVKFQTQYRWGYQPFFYLCATNECHPSYVSQFQEKNNLSVTKLNTLLAKIEPKEKKLLYDREVGDEVYNEFVKDVIQDEKNYVALKKVMHNKKVLIIGPGKNIRLQFDAVKQYIVKEKPVIIAINYLPEELYADYVFVTNVERYQQMAEALLLEKNSNIKIIATSNIESRTDCFDYKIDRKPLLEANEKIKDNSFLMLLKVLRRIGVSSVACAGLDGYSEKEDNYFNPKMEYGFVKKEARNLNKRIRDYIQEEHGEMDIQFITYSRYTELEDYHGEAF